MAAATLQAARPLIIAVAIAMLLSGRAQAHDFWIEPSTFHPRPGAIVAVGLRVGQNFVGDPVPHQSRSIERFFVRQEDKNGGKDDDIGGTDNMNPAGIVRITGETTAIVGYSSNGADIELPPQQFEDYLRLYGLDRIIDERTRRGEGAKPGRERFYRYAKALLTGGRPSAAVARPVGFDYEIVPDRDPTAQAGPLNGHVLYGGKPLAGALVEALWHDDPSVRLSMRSDAQGAFSFALPRAGVWLIKSVHMVRASFFSAADWYSLWASLTFSAPEPRPRP
jgi:hypothetical protein